MGGAAAVCALWVGRGRGRALVVQIRVEDNGVGIAASKFDLLFQPFTQVRACCKGDDLSLSLSFDLLFQSIIQVRARAARETTLAQPGWVGLVG